MIRAAVNDQQRDIAMGISKLKEIEGRQSAPSPLMEYVRLLRELHLLMAEGKGDSDKAEQLRDLMDDPWYRLNPQEVHRVGGLSADLYTLVDPPPPPQQIDQPETDEVYRLVWTAWNNKDWDQTLELLRERRHPYPPDAVAFLRAACWENLGDLETSRLFLERAVSLNPGNGSYIICLMVVLLRLGRSADVVSLADKILNREGSIHPDLLYKTGNALIAELDRPRGIDQAMNARSGS
jgi:hypothetical protein